MAAPANENAIDLLNKVPEVTIFFWIIKILATTIGETGADFLSDRLGFGLSGTSVVMGIALLVLLAAQVRADRYVPWLYWATVVFMSVVGTLITDNLTDNLDVSLFLSTAVFSVALAATFAAWYASERTLSIHTIFTLRRELFYWAAILFTFSLGTAGGDLMAEQLQLGYAPSLLIFALMIAAVTAAYYLLGANAVLAFWIAYVLTRPLGASLGDLLSQAKDDGGLGFGTFATSGIFLAVIISLVVFLTVSRVDRPDPEPVPADG